MQSKTISALFLCSILSFCATTCAQMVVHAVSGVVKAVDPNSKTMSVAIENGETSSFKLPTNAKVTLDFDNALRSDATQADKFQQVGDFAVVYYYGFDENRTAVAVKDLGKGPFEKIDGTVVSFDKHARTMTVKDDSGKSETFTLGDHLVVDLGVSVESGRSYDPRKGYSVRVTYTNSGNKNTAVFIRSRQ